MMDNSGTNSDDQNIKVIPDTAEELTHIAQEVYKKNFELAEKNKTLSLLQKIDEIILSLITRQDEIAQQVTQLLVTDIDFQLVSIFFFDKDKNMLIRLARSEAIQNENTIIEKTENSNISLFNTDNIMVQAAIERTVKISSTWEKILLRAPLTPENIKCIFVYPLIVKDELIGTMLIALKDEEKDISIYRHELLGRLAQVIGIALYNALLYDKLHQANIHLKELDRLKDDFVSLASHELRTPMTAIKSYLWMVLEGQGGPLNDKQRHYVQRSYNSVERLIRLVNDMLNISRIDSGRLTIQIESGDIEKLIAEVVEEIKPRADELGIDIVFIQPNNIPHVLADPDKIKEVIYNLIGNSLKFTPKGGKINISCIHKDSVVEVSIADTGAGIATEDFPKIFQKFGILPGTYLSNQAKSGTGLGLYICRSLVELHGGKIWGSSEGKGMGTTFTFSLKVFNQDDLILFQEKFKQTTKINTSLIHEQIQ